MQASATACNAGSSGGGSPASAGSKPVLASTCAVPMRRPHAVVGVAARRPAEHRRVPVDPERPAQLRQRACRLGQHIGAVDDRRRMAQPVGTRGRKIRAGARSPRSSAPTASRLRRIGGDHPRRIADQEGVGKPVKIVGRDRADHVVRHMLLVPDRRPVGRIARPASRRPCASRSSIDAITSSAIGWSAPVSLRKAP